MKRSLLPVIAVIAVIYATTALFRMHERPIKAEPPVAPPASDFSETIAAVGLIEPATENVAIGTPLAGVVEKVCVAAGDAVTAGAPLFVLETRQLSAQLAVRQAALGRAEAQERAARVGLADVREQLERAQRLGSGRVISADEWTRKKFAVESAEARVTEAQAEVASARAAIRETETEIDRSIVRAPLDADVLQVKIRAGEFAPAGQTAQPLLVLGRLRPLHLRVDVDEHEGWRIHPAAPAMALLRGNAGLKAALRFVRFEPMVVPKRSLTGDSTERVDTRVLQVIYAIAQSEPRLFVGQQMDVFIKDRSAAVQTVAR